VGVTGLLLMLEADQIQARLANALQGSESLSALADWLSKESASLGFRDRDLLDLADSILNPIQAYFDSLISESELRNELGLLFPRDVQQVTMRFTFDDLPAQSVEPNLEPVTNSQNSQARFPLMRFAT
jgi:hypothetical protein